MKLKSVKHSVEFVHNKFEDMKKAYECTVEIDKKTQCNNVQQFNIL